MWCEPAHRILVLARHQLVLLRRAPGPLIAYTVMPIVLTTLLEPVRARLADAGTPGIAAAAPGMLVMFSLFMTGVIGDSLLVEHAWNTWDRLRTTPTHPLELLVGKALPLLAALLTQQSVVLGYATVAYRLDLLHAGARTAAVGGAWALCVVGCGTALATVVHSHAQLAAVKDIATLTLAGLGGALIPVALLPSWAGPIAPLSPGYWAMLAYTDAFTGDAPAPVLPIGILLIAGAAGFAAAALRIRRAAW